MQLGECFSFPGGFGVALNEELTMNDQLRFGFLGGRLIEGLAYSSAT
jgi:hypothetical protein